MIYHFIENNVYSLQRCLISYLVNSWLLEPKMPSFVKNKQVLKDNFIFCLHSSLIDVLIDL